MLLPLMNLIGYMSAEKTAYYRMNAHGDVVAVVDGFGETLKTYKYDVFGGLEEDGNEWLKILFGVNVEDSNPFRYCAEYYDEETEFIYLRARYYSPEIQRFISEDPIKDGINWYAYCWNCPVNYVDPFGLAKITSVMDLWRSIISVFSPEKLENVSEDESSIIMVDSNGTIDEENEQLPQKIETLDDAIHLHLIGAKKYMRWRKMLIICGTMRKYRDLLN